MPKGDNPRSRANLKPIKKGEKRNLTGRPKGSKNFTTVFKDILQAEPEVLKKKYGITIKSDGTEKDMRTIIAKRLVEIMLRGKTRDQLEAIKMTSKFVGEETPPENNTDKPNVVEFKFTEIKKD